MQLTHQFISAEHEWPPTGVAAKMARMRLLLLAALIACTPALAGHDDVRVNPAMKRYRGLVVELAKPDADGRVYAFRALPLPASAGKYPPDEMKGWRLTFLSGKRFRSVFEVQSNGEERIVVTPVDGPLTGVAVDDFFVVEQIAVERQSE
jgi:hypothetical protein